MEVEHLGHGQTQRIDEDDWAILERMNLTKNLKITNPGDYVPPEVDEKALKAQNLGKDTDDKKKKSPVAPSSNAA